MSTPRPELWDYDNFSYEEFLCQHCGRPGIEKDFMDWLQKVRTDAGFPFVVVSGFRCTEHPLEIDKERPGEHTEGMCADVVIANWRAMDFLDVMMKHGCRRIGIRDKKEEGRVFHIGMCEDFPRALWTY